MTTGKTSTVIRANNYNDLTHQNRTTNVIDMANTSTTEFGHNDHNTTSVNFVTTSNQHDGNILPRDEYTANLTMGGSTKSIFNKSFTSHDNVMFENENQTTSRQPLMNYDTDKTTSISLKTATAATISTDNFHNASISTEKLIMNNSSNFINNITAENDYTTIDTSNSPSIEQSFTDHFIPPENVTLGSLDNDSTDYYYYHNNWIENTNVTVNESVFYINDSILYIPHFNYDGSNSFMNGIAKIDSSPETITKVFILAVVSIFGSIGNFLVVGSVIKNRHFHRPPFYFLLSMGITDLARAGFCLPVVMATALQGSIWRHGDTACKLFAFAASFFVFSSTLSLLVIGVERHLSIVHAKAYRRRCNGFINLFATVFIWVTAFIIAFPPIFASMGAGEYVFISEEAQCAYDHKHFSQNDGLNSVLTFIGITSLTLFLYYRIFVFMRSHRRMRPLQHRPAFSSTWTFVGPGANGQAFINWLNGFGGNTSNAYQRPAAAAASTVIGSNSNLSPNSNEVSPPRYTQRLNFGRVVNLCTSRNEHLTRLFFVMTLVHGATWLPYVILSLWRVFVNSSSIPSGFITYAAWLSYSQVAICPLAYFVSRRRSRHTSRVIQMESTDRNEFLLENKIFK